MLFQADFKSLTDWTNYLVARRQELEALSSTHIRWYTHKNPYGCWICDLQKLIIEWEGLYYPSPPKIDMNKDLESKVVSGEDTAIKSES